MNRLLPILALATLALSACKPSAEDSAASAAGLKPGQYSANAKGTNAVAAPNGVTTEVLASKDLGQLGVEMCPGSRLADGAIYRKTTPRDVMTTATLLCDKPFKEVLGHFEKILGKPGTTTKKAVILSGKLADGRECVITLLDESPAPISILVQLYEKL